jgi:hypothetical protein
MLLVYESLSLCCIGGVSRYFKAAELLVYEALCY